MQAETPQPSHTPQHRVPSSGFDYPDEHDAPPPQDSESARAFALLRESIIWAYRPRGYAHGQQFRLTEIAARLTAVVSTLYPDSLGVSSQEQLLRMLVPQLSRRAYELHMQAFRAHLRAHRTLFTGKPHTDAHIVAKHATRARRTPACPPTPPPGKDSFTYRHIPVVPWKVPGSRAAKFEAVEHETEYQQLELLMA